MALYKKYDVMVVSDEIWSDILLTGYCHIPTQSVSRDARERTVAFYAPTKTFSLAGLIGSYHIIHNDRLRCRVQRQGNLSGYNDCNVLSMHALTGAYSDEGMAWVDQLCAVLDRNLRYIRDFLQSRYPGVTMMLPQGTYMLFVNCGAWCRSHGITPDDLRRRGVEHGVIWQSGAGFGDGDCIRINAALPHSLVREAMDRLEKYVLVDCDSPLR